MLHQAVNLIKKKTVQRNMTTRKTRTLDPNNTKKIAKVKRMNKSKMNPLTKIWQRNKLKRSQTKANISQLKQRLQ